MFIAMNRFKIALGREQDFIDIWKQRESYLDEVPGFVSFHLLQGNTNEEFSLFASHSVWDNREVLKHEHTRNHFAKRMQALGHQRGFTLGIRS